MLSLSISNEIFYSVLHSDGILTEDQILNWVKSRHDLNQYSVHLKPLNELKGWSFDSSTANLVHESGKFFRVEGLDVQIKTDNLQCWQQPIINQPEIGVLGFVVKKFNGVLHLVVQANMEPGNINHIQISPTVQATRSNYTQVHGGKRPAFIEYFLDRKVGRILVDQLQSEQGTRYLKKRNRNVIVQLPHDYSLRHSDDYAWITFGQLQKLMRFPNLVHLDCRSILGSLRYQANLSQLSLSSDLHQDNFNSRVRASVCADDELAEWDMPTILSWLTRLKCQTEVLTTLMPLDKVAGWGLIDGVIKHESGHYFSVVGVEVTASNREVAGWSQPLVRSIDGGIIGLATQLRYGLLHFLVQGRIEPGLIDIVELAPTVQCNPKNYENGANCNLPEFVDLFQSLSMEKIRFDSMLSDEGGRFYHSNQRHLIIEIDADFNLELPPAYCWMTLSQIQSFSQFSNLVNIELRSILSCLSLAD